jgi:hypothetical protein
MDEVDEEAAGVVLVPDGVVDGSNVELAIADPGLDIKCSSNPFLERQKQGVIDLTDGYNVDMKR